MLLERSLTDLTVEEWLETLNNRFFFWLHESRLARLLGAKHYGGKSTTFLVLDTRSLIDAHGDRVRLAPMNTGSTCFPNNLDPRQRYLREGADFNYEDRRRGRSLPDRIVELAVLDGVHDIARFVVGVQRRRGPDVVQEISLV